MLEKHMMKLSLIAFLLLTLSLNAHSAEIYKWMDEEGKTHYSQTPPDGVEAEAIQPDRTPARPLTQDFTIKQPGVQGEVDVKDMQDDSGEITVIDTDKLKTYCEDQRRNLAVLQNTRRISVMEDGKSTNISYEDKEQKIQNIQKNLQEYCQ
jgi:hypothetical protein